MTLHLADLSGIVLVYLLVCARTGAMVMLLPAIGDIGVPARVRLTLALAISLAFAPVVAHQYPATAPQTVIALGLLVGQEAVAGILVGTMARIIVSALSTAGQLIAVQTGLAFAQTVDPSMSQQGAVVGNFFSLLGTVLIFSTNAHYLALGAISGSYTLLPPGGALPTSDMAELTLKLVTGSFLLGLQLAAPFLVFGFVINAAMGLLARLMPQLQVYFVAAPLGILVGFLLIIFLLGSMMTVFLTYFGTEMSRFG
jgi:flagellar biosynthetic protein FliR